METSKGFIQVNRKGYEEARAIANYFIKEIYPKMIVMNIIYEQLEM